MLDMLGALPLFPIVGFTGSLSTQHLWEWGQRENSPLLPLLMK